MFTGGVVIPASRDASHLRWVKSFTMSKIVYNDVKMFTLGVVIRVSPYASHLHGVKSFIRGKDTYSGCSHHRQR